MTVRIGGSAPPADADGRGTGHTGGTPPAEWSTGMRIGRRGLLAGGGLGLLCAAAFGTGLLSFTPATRRLLVQRVIYFYVPGIVFEGDDLEAVTEYIHRVQLTRRNGGMRRLIGYGMATPVVHTPALAGFCRADADHARDRPGDHQHLLPVHRLLGGTAGARAARPRGAAA
jgi:hypothetical protein